MVLVQTQVVLEVKAVVLEEITVLLVEQEQHLQYKETMVVLVRLQAVEVEVVLALLAVMLVLILVVMVVQVLQYPLAVRL